MWSVHEVMLAVAVPTTVSQHRQITHEATALDRKFWQEKWQRNEIGFHLPKPHPLLRRFLPELHLAKDARLFLPLCGKTLDIAWLLSQGLNVAGIELCDLAVKQLFDELGVQPVSTSWRGGTCYSTSGLRVYQGDFFELSAEELGAVDAVYDRAALVALPETMRARYTQQLAEMTELAPQLLITFEYDQARMSGPPFAVPAAEVVRLYGARYAVQELSRKELIDRETKFRERGLASFVEVAWHLAGGKNRPLPSP